MAVLLQVIFLFLAFLTGHGHGAENVTDCDKLPDHFEAAKKGSKFLLMSDRKGHGKAEKVGIHELWEQKCTKHGFEPWIPSSSPDVKTFLELVNYLGLGAMGMFAFPTGINHYNGRFFELNNKTRLDGSSFYSFFAKETFKDADANLHCVIAIEGGNGFILQRFPCEKTDKIKSLKFMQICQFPRGTKCYRQSVEEQEKRDKGPVEAVRLHTSFTGSVYVANQLMGFTNAQGYCKEKGMRMIGWNELDYKDVSVFQEIMAFRKKRVIIRPVYFWVDVENINVPVMPSLIEEEKGLIESRRRKREDGGSAAGGGGGKVDSKDATLEENEDEVEDKKCWLHDEETFKPRPSIQQYWCSVPFNVVCVEDCPVVGTEE